MSMQTQAQAPADSDALPLARKRPGEPVRRQTSARSVQHRRDVSAPDHREIERDSATSDDQRGAVVVAGVWLTFYVFAVIYPLMASGH